MEELWKDVKGFKGYEVSNTGIVRSKGRMITIKRRSCVYQRWQQERILIQHVDEDGYFYVTLYDNTGSRGVHFRVSRLVAMMFIPNPNNLPQVNHKDLNRRNNNVENLEWCDNHYNVTYKDAPMRSGLARRNNVEQSKPIYQLSKNGEILNVFPSISEASRVTGVNVSHICQTCLGNYKSAGGYLWKYKNN